MRVGINCLRVDPSYVGGATTLILGLLQGLADTADGCRFQLFVTKGNEHLFNTLRGSDSFVLTVIDDRFLSVRGSVCRASLLSWRSEIYRRVSDVAFSEIQELMESESDVVYTPTPVLCAFKGRKPSVLTMHDIQHLHHPEFFSWPRLLSRRITYGLSARYADYFQANSAYIREDLLNHFPWLSPQQIEVIPPGVRKEVYAARENLTSLCERYRIPERFLFFPAQMWPHKNHITILTALNQIEREHGLKIPLVLTGAKYSAASRIFEFIADQNMTYVHHLGVVSFQDMVALYQKATFMITATLHESSSFPILEAAASGTPVIASRIPPFEEFAAVLRLNLFNPLDVQELKLLILELWSDEKMALAQGTYNQEHIDFYSWENAARKYMQLFRRAANS